jgi:rubredoxin
MTASFSLVMPDFRAVSDEDLESLLPQTDGAWSRQTKALMQSLGAHKLNLNSNWAEVRRDWVCEACQRRKPEIARVSDNGVLLCQLEWHHDHLRDHAKKTLRPLVNIEDRTPEGRDLRRGVDACKDLTMRFFTTLICNDCNTAEGKAKGRLGDLIPSYFSFSPREITRFIRVQPNRMHGIDDEAVCEVWNEVERDVADRLAFFDILAGRVREGGLRIQGNPPQFWSPPALTSVLPRLAAQQGQDAESLYRIPGIVSERSVRHDGFGVSPRLKRTASRKPSVEDLAVFRASQGVETPWRRVVPDWRCEVCRRDRSEALRLSGKGKWTGRLHRHMVFAAERDPQALFWCVGEEGWMGAFRSYRVAYICQDCRQVVTDLRSVDASYSENALSISDLRDLVTDIEPNRKHEVDIRAARTRADGNHEYLALIEDYNRHRSHSVSLTIELSTLTGEFRMGQEEALTELTPLAWAPGFSDDQLRERLDWLLLEGRRLRREDLEREADLLPMEARA